MQPRNLCKLASGLTALIFLAFASPTVAAEEDLNAWGAATASIKASDDLVIWLEGQTRFTRDVSRLGQLLLRPAVGYRLNDTTTVFAGYAYVMTNPVGPAKSHEHRAFQQVSFRLLGDGKGVTLSGRTRLEQRFVRGADDMGWRVRQQLRLTAPLNAKLQAVGWTEPFLGLDKTSWGQRKGINVWRNFVGISVPLSASVAIEPGYLNQYVVRNGEDRMDHVASFTLNTRF